MKGPKPNIEYHYHIEELIDKQEKRSDQREYDRNKAKNLQEREDLIKDSKPYAFTDFYCVICKLDFKAQTLREVEVDWSNPTQNMAFYRTKCFKGHWLIRLITDRHKDPYWTKSLHVARDRGKHTNDMVQPYETGYNLLYGKK